MKPKLDELKKEKEMELMAYEVRGHECGELPQKVFFTQIRVTNISCNKIPRLWISIPLHSTAAYSIPR